MPNWNEVLNEVQSTPAPLDAVRRKYLRRLYTQTGRNVICYYSGWLQKPGIRGAEITDADKNGFMNAIHKLDRDKGLDLILHTPGGEVAAAESVVNYLRQMFGTNIRAIVPQICMSAGTMIACSCKSILMGLHSNLGPVDPQFGGMPAQGVLEEFRKAIEEVKEDPGCLPIWQAVISKYHPTFIGQCENAVKWSKEIVTEWLETGMFKDADDKKEKAKSIADFLTNHNDNKAHVRHIHIDKCIEEKLIVERLEDVSKLQDTVLTIHHSYMHTMSHTPALKIIENHLGKAIVNMSHAHQLK